MSGGRTVKITAATDADGNVHMLNETGDPVLVPEKDVGAALAGGMTTESASDVDARELQERHGGALEQAKTFGEGALRGATVGLSDAALVDLLGDDYREAAEERRQANPTADIAGQVGGALAGSLATGGDSLAAEGTSLLSAPSRLVSSLGGGAEGLAARGLEGLGYEGASTLGRIGAGAAESGARFATEGAALGLGNSVSDAALGDTDWTAEHALSHMAEGAMYGLGTGALVGGASAAGRAALEKMVGEGSTLKDAVQQFGEKRAVKAVVGNNQKLYNEITNFGDNPENLQRLGRKLLDEDVPLSDLGAGIKTLDQKAEEAAATRRTIAEQIDKAGVKVDAPAVLEHVDEQVARLRAVSLGSHDAVASRIESEIAPLRKAVEDEGREYSFSDWWKLRQKLDETLNWAKRAGDPATDNLRELRRTIDSGLDDAIAKHAEGQAQILTVGQPAERAAAEASMKQDLAGRWKQSGRDYGDWVTLRDAAEEQANRNEKNRFISASDYGVGAGVGHAASVLGAIAHGSLVGALPGMALGAASSLAHKFIRERGAGALARLADWASSAELSTSHVADRLAGLEGGRAPLLQVAKDTGRRAALLTELHADDQKHFEHVRNALLASEQSPATLGERIQRVIEPIAGEQPEVASAMARKLNEDHQYLVSQLPQPLGQFGRSLAPADKKPLVSKSDQKKFMSKAEAVFTPGRALKKLADGKVDFDAIDALKARRPELWNSLRTKIAMKCAEPGADVSHRRRVFLSVAFDIPADPTMAPGSLAAIGASLAPPAPEAEPAPSKVNPSEFSKSMATPSQQATL